MSGTFDRLILFCSYFETADMSELGKLDKLHATKVRLFCEDLKTRLLAECPYTWQSAERKHKEEVIERLLSFANDLEAGVVRYKQNKKANRLKIALAIAEKSAAKTRSKQIVPLKTKHSVRGTDRNTMIMRAQLENLQSSKRIFSSARPKDKLEPAEAPKCSKCGSETKFRVDDHTVICQNKMCGNTEVCLSLMHVANKFVPDASGHHFESSAVREANFRKVLLRAQGKDLSFKEEKFQEIIIAIAKHLQQTITQNGTKSKLKPSHTLNPIIKFGVQQPFDGHTLSPYVIYTVLASLKLLKDAQGYEVHIWQLLSKQKAYSLSETEYEELMKLFSKIEIFLLHDRDGNFSFMRKTRFLAKMLCCAIGRHDMAHMLPLSIHDKICTQYEVQYAHVAKKLGIPVKCSYRHCKSS